MLFACKKDNAAPFSGGKLASFFGQQGIITLKHNVKSGGSVFSSVVEVALDECGILDS